MLGLNRAQFLKTRESILKRLRSLLLNPEISELERVIVSRLEHEYTVMMAIVNAATVDYNRAQFWSTWSLESGLFRPTADQILRPLFRIQVPAERNYVPQLM